MFFVFAAMLCLAAFLPLRSTYSEGGWSEVTLAIGCEDVGSGIWLDRQFDFPTGAGFFMDLPVWSVDAVLFVGAAVAFALFARKMLQAQRFNLGCTKLTR